jgi:uncharacterized protein YceH (UPF0502 family)
MADPTPADATAPKWRPVEPTQRRVLGVLIEKAKTTPAGYPMSVNAIVAGCNQKNNRDPITSLDEIDVERALDGLRTLGAVSEIDWMGRVSKYKHHAYEWLGVDRAELAVMAELLLRGAQAMGELRGRAARMEPIEDLAALKPIVAGLVERGLVLELTPAGRGQVVSHNLYLEPEREQLRADAAGQGSRSPAAHAPDAGGASSPAPPVTSGTLAAMAGEIVELRQEIARLRERVDALESKNS